ncbi:MAG: hypothetical protein H7A24_15340 [Leptospiraceae bacterium]|nr:hypothetical protein [Leptospiraceae bacterium]MCP5513260.1 hypothetical protein [Leptospiraceae bacterium]
MKQSLSALILLSFLFTLQIFADSKQDDKVELIISDPKKKPEGSWGKEADEVDAFQDIKIIDDLSEENTIARMEEARNHFNTSLASYKSSEKLIKDKKEARENEIRPQDKYEWQVKAREMEYEREYKRISLEGRKNSVMELVKGMTAMDKIENPNAVTSQVYIDLKASIYREYIKHQLRMKNYNQAMDMIEQYLNLGDSFKRESEPHKLLAICYEFNERQASKYKKEYIARKFRRKKNQELLLYSELAYGKDSNQYKRIVTRIGPIDGPDEDELLNPNSSVISNTSTAPSSMTPPPSEKKENSEEKDVTPK